MPTLKVWMLDPAQLTPYYNIALCDSLAQAGCTVRYIGSQYLYDRYLPHSDHFKTDYHYFRGLNHTRLIQFPRLRRVLRGISYPFDHWRLARQMQENKPDILHIQWSRVPRFDRWLIQQARALGIPVIHTVHDVVPSYAPESSIRSLERVYALANRLILHTQTNRQDFLHLYPTIRREDTAIIPLINAPYQALPPNPNQATARQALGLPTNVPILLFFGSVRWYKGVDLLLSAFASARQSAPNIHLVIAGKPDTPDESALLENSRSQPNVHITSGFIPYEAIWQYYVAADVVILPYRSITQSAALLSAMDFGRAVIVTNVGGLPETIDGNGWVVPPENVPELAKSIVEATSQPLVLAAMGKRSIQLVQERHGGAAVARNTLEVYEQSLADISNARLP